LICFVIIDFSEQYRMDEGKMQSEVHSSQTKSRVGMSRRCQ
jgi:hypothetical protein